MSTTVHSDELTDLCHRALIAVGAGQRDARVLAEATVEAELVGNPAVGVAHLFDYIDGYRTGRIAADVRTEPRAPAPGVVRVDARGGLAQTAFADTVGGLLAAVREVGIAALWISNSYTCGELGHYARRLAQRGVIAVAVANSPAAMSLGGAPHSVLGTNPLAYGIPRPGQLPVVIDQASSATAFVNVRRAAAEGNPLPAGWALGPDGQPTQDAATALHGTLLPFGSHRGGNIALLVEILATLSGAAFSIDAAPFDKGSVSPGIGLCVMGIDPTNFGGSVERLGRYFALLHEDHRVRLPAMELTSLPDTVDVPADTLGRLRALTQPSTD